MSARDDHQHSHPHQPHDPHRANHRPHEEQVVLEIGGELGALIVYTNSSLLHSEIEISPAGDDSHRSHKDVLERVVAARSLYAAVFDRIPEGAYTLWHDDTAVSRNVVVGGGAVAEIRWPETT